jgi:Tol biopolymer transport system component
MGPIVYPIDDAATLRSQVYLQLPGEANPRRLYDEPGFIGYAKWSPDGEQIAFGLNSAAMIGVLVMQADGGDVRKFVDQPGGAGENTFAWGPGDNELTYYKQDALGTGDLWAPDVDGAGNPTRLTWDGGLYRDPAWSPSRDRLAYMWRPAELRQEYSCTCCMPPRASSPGSRRPPSSILPGPTTAGSLPSRAMSTRALRIC